MVNKVLLGIVLLLLDLLLLAGVLGLLNAVSLCIAIQKVDFFKWVELVASRLRCGIDRVCFVYISYETVLSDVRSSIVEGALGHNGLLVCQNGHGLLLHERATDC